MSDCEWLVAPKCPHCGHMETDAWEWDFGGEEGDRESTCAACGEEFMCSRHVTIRYTSTLLASPAAPKP